MRFAAGSGPSSRAGFSLIEVVAATAIFSIVGYVLVVSVDMGSRSRDLVQESFEENRAVLAASDTLVEEIMVSNDDQIEVVQLADGNSQVTLRVPIEVGGVLTWGTEGDDITVDPEMKGVPNEDWCYRYTVVQDGEDKCLVRQVLNEKLVVQSEETLVERLDTTQTPSFSVAKDGEMWVIGVAPQAGTERLSGENNVTQRRRSEIHVRTRN